MLSKKEYWGIGRVPLGIGSVLHGWDFTEDEFRNPNTLSVVDFRAMSNACPHDCFHCYTDKMKKTLTLAEIKNTIDQLADLGAHAIDYLGEGEPTIDPDFFPIIEYTAKRGIIPVIFTDAATMMRDRDFVRHVFGTGASVVPKCDSLFNPAYQNWVVRDKTNKFFDQRNEALNLLIDECFSLPRLDGTTSLGFDMVVSSRNIDEVGQTVRFCRERNLWVVFSFYLPAGRSGNESFDQSLIVGEDQKAIMRAKVLEVDREFGFDHPLWNNFATIPCVERIQIYGDGRIGICPGNEEVMGHVQTDKIAGVHQKIRETYPIHNPETFDGHCPYRSPL